MRTINDLSLRDNEKKAIAEATRTLKEKFPVQEVILFGSKARGMMMMIRISIYFS